MPHIYQDPNTLPKRIRDGRENVGSKGMPHIYQDPNTLPKRLAEEILPFTNGSNCIP
jgi:hypothetical protein